jgi:[ribosomal protein S5]-alanine N-acetyltransferase
VLEDGPVRLRPLTMSDSAAWRSLKDRNRAWLSRWEATVPPGDHAGRINFRQMVRMLRSEALQARMLPFAVDYAEPVSSDTLLPTQRQWRPGSAHRLVGQVTVSGIGWGSLRSANIGYWVDEECAGHGVIPTAVALAVDHCFNVCGLHRIEVCIRPENVPSRRVVEKLGFREEGIRRAYLHIDGAWRDHATFALTAEEVPEGLLARWHAIRSADAP